MTNQSVQQTIAKLLPDAEKFLCDLIRFESTPCNEQEAMLFCEREFRQLGGDLVAHIVVEEEKGGNGSLAMAGTGGKADGCVVLEASDGKLFTSSRGAVWFHLELQGKAGHSGQAGQTRSALLMARDAIA